MILILCKKNLVILWYIQVRMFERQEIRPIRWILISWVRGRFKHVKHWSMILAVKIGGQACINIYHPKGMDRCQYPKQMISNIVKEPYYINKRVLVIKIVIELIMKIF